MQGMKKLNNTFIPLASQQKIQVHIEIQTAATDFRNKSKHNATNKNNNNDTFIPLASQQTIQVYIEIQTAATDLTTTSRGKELTRFSSTCLIEQKIPEQLETQAVANSSRYVTRHTFISYDKRCCVPGLNLAVGSGFFLSTFVFVS